MRRPLIPDDWPAEQALDCADFLYQLADEILRRYDGPIRIHYRELDDIRRRDGPDYRQLSLPLPPHLDDWPF